MPYNHVPVLLKEVIDCLNPRPGQNFIDCTLGGGGYTLAIAEKIAPAGKIIALDLDPLAISNLRLVIEKNQDKYKNITIINDNFKNLQTIYAEVAEEKKLDRIDGIVFDLGLSSAQLQDPDRGFSFQVDAPLNMNFGNHTGIDTEYILNNYERADLEKIIRDYGEEKFYRPIVNKILTYRQTNRIESTGQLMEIIKTATPPKYRFNRKTHFATKTFQALRIASNQELDNLSQALPQAIEILSPGGRLAVVSFHSLEDRIVKNMFKQEARECVCPPSLPICNCNHKAKIKIINRKIITPTLNEEKENPRSRSAKLRVAEKK